MIFRVFKNRIKSVKFSVLLISSLFYLQLYAQPGPEILYKDLFRDVQLSSVFKDSKTFVDCVPLFPPDSILHNYHRQKDNPDFSLSRFITAHFQIPDTSYSGFRSDTSRSVIYHIDTLWNFLTHQPNFSETAGTLIPLPHPYVVPGGRFREIYYWDSFFTMLGLKASGRDSLIRHMTDNFAWLIDRYGFIPNGNRTYYLSRSQPPFFSLMVRLLADIYGDSILLRYLPQLEKEYAFWMKGSETLSSKRTDIRNVVRLGQNYILNRYWDQDSTPRPESFREDFLSGNERTDKYKYYRDIRAACESGWDFSTRWFADGRSPSTIHTTDIIPVDLNSLLYHLEKTLQEAYFLKGDSIHEKKMGILAENRKKAISIFLWNKTNGFFMDYDFVKKKNTSVYSLSGMYPLYFRLASPDQAGRIVSAIRNKFIYPGGLVTTLTESGQQWDAPNGWAPLQWISIHGLRNYNYFRLANEIKKRWIGNNIRVFKSTGKLIEKYNVKNIHLKSGGGEYATQDGFGWTNGVLLDLMRERQTSP